MSSYAEKSLAAWKVWWAAGDIETCVEQLLLRVVPTNMPGGGQLIKISQPIHTADFRCPNLAGATEAIIRAYPASRVPSAYFFGDVVLLYNIKTNFGLLGPPEANPVKEQARRDLALTEGKKLSLLLAYIRRVSSKTKVGATPAITYLKSLVQPRARSNSHCSPHTKCILELEQTAHEDSAGVAQDHAAPTEPDDSGSDTDTQACQQLDDLLGITALGDAGSTPVPDDDDEAFL